MYCSHCGKEISVNETFCRYCGAKNEYKKTCEFTAVSKKQNARRTKKSIKIGSIIGIIFCISIIIVVYMQKSKSLDNINVSNSNEETELELTIEEKIVADVKTAEKLQSATQASLADEKAYENVCHLDGIGHKYVLIMTINKNGEYIYPEGLDIFAEELKSVYSNSDERINIKYTEKGADSFNIYLSEEGGVVVYIGSKDETRKWEIVPFTDEVYQVNNEVIKNSVKDTSVQKTEGNDSNMSREDAIAYDAKTAEVLMCFVEGKIEGYVYENITHISGVYEHEVLIMTINNNGQFECPEGLEELAKKTQESYELFYSSYGLKSKISIECIDEGVDCYNFYFTTNADVSVYLGTKDEPKKMRLDPDTDSFIEVNNNSTIEDASNQPNEDMLTYLSHKEAIDLDVKTAERLQSVTQSALANTEVYDALTRYTGSLQNDMLIMTISKNGGYFYPEGLSLLADEIKEMYGADNDNIIINYTEKGAESFNIYYTPLGGIIVYIGSTGDPRKWRIVPEYEASDFYYGRVSKDE